MLIFAHRGLKLEYPENTLVAFKVAADLDFGIELDVRLTGDGQLVCIHDADTQTLTGVLLKVREATVEELKRLKFGSRFDPAMPKTEIALFDDVVKQVISAFPQGQRAAIHVKADEQGETQLGILLELFARHQLYQKAFLFDLTFESAERVRKADPKVEIAFSIGEENYSPTIYTWEQAREHLDLFDAVWWDEWKILGSVYNEPMRQAIRNAGKPIYAISPELHADHGNPHASAGYEQEWQNFIKWGIEGVCTAHPREFQRLLGDS